MRFQCKIGSGVKEVRPVAPRVPMPRIALPQRTPAAPRGRGFARSAIAGAVLMAAAGCASLDASVAKRWKVEPVFSVTHSVESSQGYYTLGQYFDASMAWDKSIDAYRKAIAADAHAFEAYNALGVALAQAGRYADAETTLRQAVALAPDRTHMRNNLGYVLLMAGKPQDAVVELKAAVDRDGSSAIAKANLRNAMARSSAAADVTAVAAASAGETPVPVAPERASATWVVTHPVSVDLGDGAINVDVPVSFTTTATRADPPTAPQDLRVGFRPTAVPLSAPTAASADSPGHAAFRLEVSNGNGSTGMAARVGRWLTAQGVTIERLSNQQRFAQRLTVVQYRSGHEEAALRVAQSLPASAKAEPRPTPGLRSDVRVVLGRDWVQTAVCLERDACRRPATAVAAVAVEAPR